MKIPNSFYAVIDEDGNLTSNLIDDYHEALNLARTQVTDLDRDDTGRIVITSNNARLRYVVKYNIVVEIKK